MAHGKDVLRINNKKSYRKVGKKVSFNKRKNVPAHPKFSSMPSSKWSRE